MRVGHVDSLQRHLVTGHEASTITFVATKGSRVLSLHHNIATLLFEWSGDQDDLERGCAKD